MVDKENIIETFAELAPRYEEVVNAELDRFWGWSYVGFVNQLIQSTQIPDKGRVLDLATGTGVIPITVASNGYDLSRVHGLDITMPMLAHARKKIISGSVKNQVDLVCASAMEVPYTSVTCPHCLCHSQS